LDPKTLWSSVQMSSAVGLLVVNGGLEATGNGEKPKEGCSLLLLFCFCVSQGLM